MFKHARFSSPAPRLLAILSVVILSSCGTTKHVRVTADAQQRWDQVRGGVKLQLARQNFDAGLFDDAAAMATAAIALDSSDASAYLLLTQSHVELGGLAAAWRTLEAARKAGVRSAGLCYNRGVVLEQRRKLEEALLEYTAAQELDETNVDFVIARAECLVAMDRTDEAMALIRQQDELLDDDGSLSALMAHIASLFGDKDEALRLYGRALASHQTPAIVAQERGRLLVSDGRYVEARAVLEPLLRNVTDATLHGSVRRDLATCMIAMGDGGAAKAILSPYAKKNPDDGAAQLLLAKASMLTGDIMTAIRAVDLAALREPNNPDVWLVRATVFWKRGRYDAAANDLYDVLLNDPEDVEARCLLAEVLASNENYDGARQHFQRALASDPASAWATEGLEAVARAERASTIEPQAKLTAAELEPNSHPRP